MGDTIERRSSSLKVRPNKSNCAVDHLLNSVICKDKIFKLNISKCLHLPKFGKRCKVELGESRPSNLETVKAVYFLSQGS